MIIDGNKKPDWCPGCGNFAILLAVKNALNELKYSSKDVAVISGIGCSAKLPHWLKTYGLHSLHGRALPNATGVHLANHKLKVLACGGDGDGYGIGIGHFIHCMRRNLDMVYLVHNNQIYGLTKGQASPTTEKGTPTVTTPNGVIEPALNPLRLALSSDCTFVARGFAGEIEHLKELIKAAFKHKGFAMIDILQPCVTFNKINTYKWFQERVYKLEDTNYKTNNLEKAYEKAGQWGNKIPIGILYQEKKETYTDQLPQLAQKALIEHDITNIDITKLVDNYL